MSACEWLDVTDRLRTNLKYYAVQGCWSWLRMTDCLRTSPLCIALEDRFHTYVPK